MSSWGKNDNAANAPYWAVNSTIVNATDAKSVAAAPTAANVALLYGNTTADVYTTGQTIGLFGVDAQEAAADQRGAHTGWVLRTTGSGGRAGRVQEEVLVAMSEFGFGLDGDAQAYANVTIRLSGPSSASVLANATYYANVATFSVTPTLTGNTAATLTYLWEKNDDGTWASIPANTTPIQYSGATSATLYARPATTANTGTIYRVTVTAADSGVVVVSANAVITVA